MSSALLWGFFKKTISEIPGKCRTPWVSDKTPERKSLIAAKFKGGAKKWMRESSTGLVVKIKIIGYGQHWRAGCCTRQWLTMKAVLCWHRHCQFLSVNKRQDLSWHVKPMCRPCSNKVRATIGILFQHILFMPNVFFRLRRHNLRQIFPTC